MVTKRAFTLSEILIALAIIAILSAALLPIMHNLVPDQNVLMAKRAFQTTETIVSNLLNSKCYPKQRTLTGFEDGKSRIGCDGWNLVAGRAEKDNAQQKFLTLFDDKLDTKSITDGGKTVITKDGMEWKFNGDFNNSKSAMYLTVDVNGVNNDPNCGQSSKSTSCARSRKNGFDKFTMKINPNGQIKIMDCWANLAVRVDKKITGHEDITKICANMPNDDDSESTGCVGTVAGLCVKNKVVGGTGASYSEIYDAIKEVDPSYVRPKFVWGDDNWQMANDYCEKVAGGRLPTFNELKQMVEYLYGTTTENSSQNNKMKYADIKDRDIYSKYNIQVNSNGYFSLWSSDKDGSNYAYRADFNYDHFDFGYSGRDNGRHIMCVE